LGHKILRAKHLKRNEGEAYLFPESETRGSPTPFASHLFPPPLDLPYSSFGKVVSSGSREKIAFVNI
jgi:hypothetical protein